MSAYNFKDFDLQFPDDAACLDFIFRARFANHVCECGKSGGIVARGVGHKIRELMAADGNLFAGVVEADETYIGGVRKGKRGRGALGKTAVVGIVERRGGVCAKVMDRVTTAEAIKLIRLNVKPGTTVHTDEFPIYNYVGKLGFGHEVVNHGRKEYVRGRVHTNTIDGFWSQVKRSLDGTHHSVSPKYLQSYVNEFAWRYSHRFDGELFASLVAKTGSMPSKAAGETSI
jgi:transposase-like protein